MFDNSVLVFCLLDVLVVPSRNVERLTDLTSTEVGSLFASVQAVGRVVEKAYKADGLTIACQVSYFRPLYFSRT